MQNLPNVDLNQKPYHPGTTFYRQGPDKVADVTGPATGKCSGPVGNEAQRNPATVP